MVQGAETDGIIRNFAPSMAQGDIINLAKIKKDIEILFTRGVSLKFLTQLWHYTTGYLQTS